MKYNIILTDLATITSEYNLMFLHAFNPKYSLKMKNSIMQSIKSLTNFPNSHSIYKKINNKIYRKLLVNNIYHIIFTVKQNNVFVFYVNDARRNIDTYYNSLN